MSRSVIKKIAAEGRKFGVGFAIISQRPSKLDADVTSQCNTLITMRIKNPEDQRFIVKSTEQLSQADIDELPLPARDLLPMAAMGGLHFLGQVPYGVGAWLLGPLGTSIGWGATIGSQLLAANGLGLALGEWRGAPRGCRWLIAVGITVTLAAVAMLARASALAAP